jgi:hypothetical protein
MVFDEVLPLYFTAPTYAGGLGVTSTEFAKMLSILGVIQLFFQFVVYPKATRLWNTLQLIRVAFLVFIPLYFIFPELTPLRIWLEANVTDETTKYWVFRGGYFALLFVRFLCNCISFTSLGIMVRQ